MLTVIFKEQCSDFCWSILLSNSRMIVPAPYRNTTAASASIYKPRSSRPVHNEQIRLESLRLAQECFRDFEYGFELAGIKLERKLILWDQFSQDDPQMPTTSRSQSPD